MINVYFRLNPECYYVEGDHCGAIYDLIEGTVYALDPHESEIIRNCENNQLIDGSEEFLRELKRICLGNFYDTKVYIEKLRVGSPVEEYQAGRPPHLLKAFLEINNMCEQSCWYCGYYGIRRSLGCMGCNKWNEQGKHLDTQQWKQIIDELRDLECPTIYFIGGDLTSEWDKTLLLIDYATDSFKEIYVVIHDRNFSNLIAEDLKNKAHPIIQIEDPTQIRENCSNLLIVKNNNSSQIMNTSLKNVAFDIISNDFTNLTPESPLSSKKKINKVDIHSFSRNKKYHPCLGNTIAISWNGEILPCPLLRHHSLGNINNLHLYTIFQKKGKELEKFWNMSLKSLKKCRNCEFAYACLDCRALEESLIGNLENKLLCSYDPTKGIWV